ncbi:triacylglycerol lipase OBL1-like [Cornus florida]|uniref:triacylglycerol lipase OBL1-like n=1 Tax=Cornus florida TaxID=4283 RepID=UPI00289A3DD6|nr:triacylglycerol lipase OBL1-like [Cornus florida]
MACDEEFCKDYLVLKPEEGSLFDLVRILRSSELDKREFVEFSGVGKLIRGLEYRWIVSVSFLAQKLLLYLKKPLARIGFLLEMWLNLLSSNGGAFFPFLLNTLKGNFVWPNRTSATFTSVVGNLDLRVELDKNMRNGDRRYATSLSMMAAKLAYENAAFVQTIVTEHWNMEFLGFFSFWNDYQNQSSTQAIMFHDTSTNSDLIMVAFRGTEPFDADKWCTDVDISWYELENVGRIHGGFMKALGLQKGKGWPKKIEQGLNEKSYAYYTIRQKLRDLLQKHEKAKFVVTGHSLGGALAILFAAVLGFHEEEGLLNRLEGVYTFGQPRVGNKKFGEFMEGKMRKYDVRYIRFVYCNDIVPRLPYEGRTLLFKHFGTCLYYNSCYKGKVVWEEPNKNYFSVLWAIPKILNAVWELIRSFIIPYIKGSDYKEGWFLRFVRVFGLAVPGLSAHGPEDYVNVTRLGSLHSLLSSQGLIQQQGLKHE